MRCVCGAPFFNVFDMTTGIGQFPSWRCKTAAIQVEKSRQNTPHRSRVAIPPAHRVESTSRAWFRARHRRLVAPLVRVVLQREAPVRRPEVPVGSHPARRRAPRRGLRPWWCWGRPVGGRVSCGGVGGSGGGRRRRSSSAAACAARARSAASRSLALERCRDTCSNQSPPPSSASPQPLPKGSSASPSSAQAPNSLSRHAASASVARLRCAGRRRAASPRTRRRRRTRLLPGASRPFSRACALALSLLFFALALLLLFFRALVVVDDDDDALASILFVRVSRHRYGEAVAGIPMRF